MKKAQVIRKFLDKPYTLDMGAGKLANWWGVSEEIIREAKKDARKILQKPVFRGDHPRILFFDIETSPVKAFVWQTQVWRASISDDKIISEWFMLSWAAKWIDETTVISDCLNSEEAIAENDGRIIKSLWKMLDEADIVIAHNGDYFDVPNMNTRFIVHGLNPTSPYQTIDTYKVAKRQFGFTHNKLRSLANIFGIQTKLDTTFELWKDCIAGNKKALAYMEEYNRRDIDVLEAVYYKLRPWMVRHPNLGLYLENEEATCPKCGSINLKPVGHYYTSVSKFETLQCKDCGSLARKRLNVYPKELRKNLVTTLAR